MSEEPRQNKGRELVDCKLNEAHPSNIIAGRPKTALLFWLFGGFRCGVWLFIVHLLGYMYIKLKIGKNYDGPNGSLFISILLRNSEFGIRNCEVYVV